MYRIGQGYDVHALKEGETLILGGVKIKHYKGTIAHSDGDVLIHALIDALLGAASLRDIGFHFSDSDEKWKNVSSLFLLKKTVDLLKKNNYEIVNVDTTIVLQKPKIKEFIPFMIEKLAETMSLSKELVSVKATTTEKLSFEGREEGISAYAIALIRKI